MIYSRTAITKTLSVLALAGAVAASHIDPAVAQSAGNVVCNGCVDSKDIKNKSVGKKDIRGNSVTGPKVKDGSLTGADMMDGSVTAADMMDEGGADFALGPVDFQQLTLADTVYASVTITAPKAGVVIANATAFVTITSANARLRCSISTGSVIDDSHRFGASLNGVPNAFGATQTVSGSRGFNVSAGSTTFNLVCEQFAGSDFAFIGAPHMTAMYFPSQY